MNLRRAVSAAYYSVFHELSNDGALVAGGRRAARMPHRGLARRAFLHPRMAEVSQDFTRNAGWIAQSGTAVTGPLRDVASAFLDLQQRRHVADYALATVFVRSATLETIAIAHSALTTWRSIRRAPEAEFFLVALLLGRTRRS